MIEFHQVSAGYEGNESVVRNLNLRIADGEFVAFLGQNGAGKSTTMRLLNGLLLPTTGRVLIDGVPTSELSTSALASRVGFLFQNPDRQICCNTVHDELLFGFRVQERTTAQAETRVKELADTFGLALDADPFLLSRGARQLLALASVLALNPPVLVLDEPTTELDFRECETVMHLVKRAHESGTTVVMVCHDMEVVADYATRCVVMAGGYVIDDGPTFKVLRNRETIKRASLVPPQIVGVSMALADASEAFAASAVAHANTLDEMEEAVVAQARARAAHARTASPTQAKNAPTKPGSGTTQLNAPVLRTAALQTTHA